MHEYFCVRCDNEKQEKFYSSSLLDLCQNPLQLFSVIYSVFLLAFSVQWRCKNKSVLKNTRHIAEAHDPDIINSIIEEAKKIGKHKNSILNFPVDWREVWIVFHALTCLIFTRKFPFFYERRKSFSERIFYSSYNPRHWKPLISPFFRKQVVSQGRFMCWCKGTPISSHENGNKSSQKQLFSLVSFSVGQQYVIHVLMITNERGKK